MVIYIRENRFPSEKMREYAKQMVNNVLKEEFLIARMIAIRLEKILSS